MPGARHALWDGNSDPYTDGYRYANTNSNSHLNAYANSNGDSYSNSYSYSYGQTNAYWEAEHNTETTSHSRAAANPALECHVEKPIESAQLLYETEVHNWIQLT